MSPPDWCHGPAWEGGSSGRAPRPLHARVACDNVASLRVLEKCGFRVHRD
jgi:hypothetical protein